MLKQAIQRGRSSFLLALKRVAWSILDRARPRRVLQFSILFFRGVAKAALYCAHRATTALSWGLCEQEG
jgi:hypothetical protein